jgi:hypothetical protein
VLIALLIAGKEVIAFGNALSQSNTICWTYDHGAAGENWLLECEIEEEADENDENSGVTSSSSFVSHGKLFFFFADCDVRVDLSKFEFLTRFTEFYIYVLNLRL